MQEVIGSTPIFSTDNQALAFKQVLFSCLSHLNRLKEVYEKKAVKKFYEMLTEI
jgi:hypothetical protein